ncbi:MAG: hypothetical protein MK132_06535 [Lentisphaerales bacterium]|nr:hypothetical protein [Lentisphaerales bacterium]
MAVTPFLHFLSSQSLLVTKTINPITAPKPIVLPMAFFSDLLRDEQPVAKSKLIATANALNLFIISYNYTDRLLVNMVSHKLGNNKYHLTA